MDYRYRVYCHTNKFNDKKYIGITMLEPIKRWLNGNGYRSNVLFFKDIEKYGWESFNHEVLYDNLSKDEAENIERTLIKKFNTTSFDYGYNKDNGGTGKGRMTESNKEKLKSNKKPDGYKTRQINLSFKDNDREIAIYEWLNTKYSKGAYIKELLLKTMEHELNN